MTLPRFGDREDAKTPCLIDAYRTARDVSSTVADLSPATLRGQLENSDQIGR